MRTKLNFCPANLIRTLTVIVFSSVFAMCTVHGQEATAPKTVLDFEGNRIFSKQDLFAVANKCLAGYSKSQNEDDPLDYCLYSVTRFMHAKGYLQAHLSNP